MIGSEADVLKTVGQTGAAGVFLYAILRFGPLIENLFKRKNGKEGSIPPPAKPGEPNNSVTWDKLIQHCDRSHEQAARTVDARLKGVESGMVDLKKDFREGLKELKEDIRSIKR